MQAPPSKKQKLEVGSPSSESLPQESCDVGTSHEKGAIGEKVVSQENSTTDSHLGHVMEKDVGITEYISPHLPGFFAILKQR